MVEEQSKITIPFFSREDGIYLEKRLNRLDSEFIETKSELKQTREIVFETRDMIRDIHELFNPKIEGETGLIKKINDHKKDCEEKLAIHEKRLNKQEKLTWGIYLLGSVSYGILGLITGLKNLFK